MIFSIKIIIHMTLFDCYISIQRRNIISIKAKLIKSDGQTDINKYRVTEHLILKKHDIMLRFS